MSYNPFHPFNNLLEGQGNLKHSDRVGEARATYKAPSSYSIKTGDTVELFGGTVFKDIKRTAPRSPQFEGTVVKLGEKPGKLKVGERGTFAATNIARKLSKES